MTLILKLNSDVWDLFEALDRIDEKIDHLLLIIYKNSCTISVF